MRLLLILATVLTLPAFAAPTSDYDAIKILLESDKVRFPREDFETHIRVVTVGDNPSDAEFDIVSKGNDKTLVKTTQPAEDEGRIMLMLGRELWLFLPEISQPVRLSSSQRATGEIANGDLARANFSGDYNPTISAKETIDGKDYWLLNLVAVDKSVTYARVNLWVEVANNHPLKAEFFTVSGKLFKTCEYTNFKKMEGRVRPTKIIMRNTLKEGEVSEMTYASMKLKPVPDKMFTKDYLKKL